MIVDEPETHLHTLLAIKLWDVLERERPDLRFIYITHDLTFALSRTAARYVLASPLKGLKALELKEDLPGDVAEVLLGSASLSFYANRVIFTEGQTGGLDDALYGAWFNGRDTVVRAVGSCDMVGRCTDALAQSGVAQSLSSIGIIDADFHPETWVASRSAGMHVLKVHEVESLFCLPGVVAAVAAHQGRPFNHDEYLAKLKTTVTASDRHRVIIERWKNRIEPAVLGLTRAISNKEKPVAELSGEVESIFDQSQWSFSPVVMLEEERKRVESAVGIEEILLLMPGKSLIQVAAQVTGQTTKAYCELIVSGLAATEGSLLPLGTTLHYAMVDYLPARHV